jgi:chromosome segregation ATPase
MYNVGQTHLKPFKLFRHYLLFHKLISIFKQILEYFREKCNDLHNELDTSLKTIDIFRKKLDGNSRKFEEIQTELYQNRIQTQKINDEKAILAIEIERLKGLKLN